MNGISNLITWVTFNELQCFSDPDDLYGREYGLFRPKMHVPARNNIEGFEFTLGAPGFPGVYKDNIDYKVLY